MERHQRKVDKDTPLRMKRGERLPDPGEDNPVYVGEKAWEENNQRRDTANGHATDEPPIE